MGEPRKPPWRKRLALAAGAGLAVGAGAIALGPAAPLIVDYAADGQRVWRLGRIEVDGVSGGWLGDLRAERVRIADAEGVWLEAEDLALAWSPLELLFGDFDLARASARRIAIARRPILSDPRPSGNARFDVNLADIQVARLELAEAVAGQGASFSAAFAMDLRGSDLRLLRLDLTRFESDADAAHILYRPDGEYALRAQIDSAPGGVLAMLLGVGEQGFSASAQGQGEVQTGQARYSAAIGALSILEGRAEWTPQRWSAQGRAQLDAVPGLDALAARIGESLELAAEGERIGAFELRAATPLLALELDGALNQRRELVNGARILISAEDASAIAPEAPVELGAARFEGELRRARGVTAVQGALDARQINAFGQRTRFSGPVRAALREDAFELSAQLAAAESAPAAFAQGRLEVELSYDRDRARFALQSAQLVSQALRLEAQGWAGRGDGEFSGRWRVARLAAFSADLRGEASGAWRAFAAPAGAGARVWTVTVQGQGANMEGSPAIVPQLLGQSPRLDAMLRSENGGISVAHARLDGARLRAGMIGRIVEGRANLSLEASARGPLDLGGAVVEGALDATGALTGPISRPTLTAEAVMQGFEAGGALIEQPRLSITLAPNGRGYQGLARVAGAVSGQPLNASAAIALADNAIALSDLDAQVGGLAAQGSASVTPRGVSADLDVSGQVDGVIPGASGRFAGRVALTPEVLQLDAEIRDAQSGDLFVRAATLRARGPMRQINAEFDMRGRLRQAPLSFTGTAALDLQDSSIQIDGRGALAGEPIFTRAPITAAWGGREVRAGLNVAMGNGVLQAQWRERGRSLSGSAHVEDAPIAPLAAIWGERASGIIDGRINLANSGGGLSGDADLILRQARFAGRQRAPLSMRIVSTLAPSRLRANIEARSEDGLVALFEADAPVVTDADPIRIALAPERRGRATWSVQGPAESLWAASRLQDQHLQGTLEGRGELLFGAGYLSGDGHVEIVNGRFEDKLTGAVLADLNARLAINDNGVTIERFTANSPRGGSLSASGGSVSPREGSINVTINDMRVANRPDAFARASGELTLSWEGVHSSFSGELNIAEAAIDIGANPSAGIATIEVIEINRPDMADDPPPGRQAETRNGSTRLDVNVRAPGRVFTRGRGVDAEWRLDMRLGGTIRNPQVFGAAEALRGEIALSGAPFSIEDARISFGGDPLDARINVTARRDTAGLSALMRITGTARNPAIAFSSEPALPEDEILPQILFGRGVADLSALEAAQLASSLATLSGQASFNLVDAARAATGLDRFAVRQDEDGGLMVAGGIYLTRDVYLEVARTGLGQAQTQLEWTVRPRLVLITTFRGDGDQRISLRWRRETD